MDDLLFYVLCNSTSVISGRYVGDTRNERLCIPESRLRLKKSSQAGFYPENATSTGQRLTHCLNTVTDI